jgi:vancomycin permeability regulator SanA
VRRRLLIALIGLLLVAAGGVLAIHHTVRAAASGRLYTVAEAPDRSVAIVFGAGRTSRVLRDRVLTGAELYRQHKVRHLLLSGDNRRPSYDEPRTMRRLALEAGVPESALVLDYAGRRTYDSCARAHSIFRVDDAILVTQGFHLTRALYLCHRLGMGGAVGVVADRHGYRFAGLLAFRELLADVKAWFDVNVHHPQVVGGPAIPIRDQPPPDDEPADEGD